MRISGIHYLASMRTCYRPSLLPSTSPLSLGRGSNYSTLIPANSFLPTKFYSRKCPLVVKCFQDSRKCPFFETHYVPGAFLASPRRGFSTSLCVTGVASSYSALSKPILPEVWDFSTEPFGKLIFEAPFHVHVQPLDPVSCPDQDKISVTLRNEEEKLLPNWMDGVECQVVHDPIQKILHITGALTEAGHALFPSLESLPVFMEIFIPIKYNVDIVTSHHGRVSVKGLECDSVDILTEAGQTNTSGLKVSRMRVTSSYGEINCRGSLYGDVCLMTAGSGAINLNKIQGSLSATTEGGALWAKSAYVTRSSLATVGGDVRVTTLTGSDNQVTTLHGDVTLDSVDGCVEASTQTGNVSVTFSRVPTEAGVVACVTSESGDVDVKVGDDVSATFVIAADDVSVDKKLATLHSDHSAVEGRGSPMDSQEDLNRVAVTVGKVPSQAVINIVSRLGKVSLEKKDWFAAFKFGS